MGRAARPRCILLDAFLRGHLVWEECKGVIYLDCVPKYSAEYFLEDAFTKSELKLLWKLAGKSSRKADVQTLRTAPEMTEEFMSFLFQSSQILKNYLKVISF